MLRRTPRGLLRRLRGQHRWRSWMRRPPFHSALCNICVGLWVVYEWTRINGCECDRNGTEIYTFKHWVEVVRVWHILRLPTLDEANECACVCVCARMRVSVCMLLFALLVGWWSQNGDMESVAECVDSIMWLQTKGRPRQWIANIHSNLL